MNETADIPTRFFVFDTETSGLGDDAGVCEIGWVELDAQAQIIGQCDALLDPEGPISPSASGIHGIEDKDVVGKPTIAEFFSVDDPSCLGSRLAAPRIVFVGHKASFDRRFIAPYLDGEVLELCTLRWARKLWPQADDHKLSTLKYALGLRKDAGEAHRVMADILVTYDLLRVLLSMTGITLTELAIASQEPMLLERMPFGKYKGQHPRDVEKSYWRWALNNIQDMDDDLKYTALHYSEN